MGRRRIKGVGVGWQQWAVSQRDWPGDARRQKRYQSRPKNPSAQLPAGGQLHNKRDLFERCRGGSPTDERRENKVSGRRDIECVQVSICSAATRLPCRHEGEGSSRQVPRLQRLAEEGPIRSHKLAGRSSTTQSNRSMLVVSHQSAIASQPSIYAVLQVSPPTRVFSRLVVRGSSSGCEQQRGSE